MLGIQEGYTGSIPAGGAEVEGVDRRRAMVSACCSLPSHHGHSIMAYRDILTMD